MSFTQTPQLNLQLPSDDSVSHGDELRQNWAVVAQALCPENIYWVSPEFTDANLHNSSATNRRHFETIQAAITAAEGSTYSHPATICIWPGTYEERLSITGSINLMGMVEVARGGYGGLNAIQIRGDGTENPVISVSPASGETCCVGFSNISFDNSYSTASSVPLTQINKPYLIDLNDNASSTYGSVVNCCTFKNCEVRGQTWGDHNEWAYGIRADGWWRLNLLHGFRFCGLSYAGNEDDGGVEALISISNDHGTYNSQLFVQGASLYQEYAGHSGGTAKFVEIDGGVTGTAMRSDFGGSATIVSAGATGTNTINGLSASFAAYMNSYVDGIFY